MENKSLLDHFGREIRNMRISVTDRCNFRCVYCMPEEPHWMKRDDILSFEEIVRLARIAVNNGIRKIRLTGGEPLVRRGCPDLVRMLIEIGGIKDISMTTNGVFLKSYGKELWDAGLRRINVSLDTMNREKFIRIARHDGLHKVLEGLEEAKRVGFRPLKVNVVVMSGFNDDEIVAFAEMSRSGEYKVRFIEFMPIDGDGNWNREKVISGQEIVNRIHERYPLIPVEGRGSDPAKRYRFADGAGEIGVIASVTEAFCSACDRIRLTADGKLRTCLFATQETDLRTMMINGATDEELTAVFLKAVWNKEEGHRINTPEFQQPSRAMYAVGG